MTRRIFVASVQHTGTWFTLRLLAASPDVAGVIIEEEWEADPRCPGAPGVQVLHAHVGHHPTPVPLDGDLQWFGPDVPLIVPVRDPLASLVTRATRAPEHDHFDIVEGFRRVAALQAFFFPVDLGGDRAGRAEALFRHAGVRPCAPQRIRDWRPEGASPQSRRVFHESFAKGDWHALEASIGPALRELVRHEGELRPWLEQLGYRELVWWGR